MKTVRFSQVVAKRGRPESHLVLTDPKKDRALQSAAKAHRVLTVMQSSAGSKAPWGEVGFYAGQGRQHLIFPKSLAAYAGKSFIGIKYELLSDAESPPRRAPAAPKPAKPAKKAKPAKPAKPAKKASVKSKPLKVAPETTSKTQPPVKKEEAPEVTQLKRQVKRAMQALEKGRQVVAFNLLQKIVAD